MSSITSTSTVTAVETLPPFTSSWTTTVVVESLVAGPGPGTSTSEYLTTMTTTTTYPASTRTEVLDVPVIIPVTSATQAPSTVVTSAGSYSYSTTPDSTIVSSTSAGPTPTSTSITVVPKSSSPNTTAIAIGVSVPLVSIILAVIIYVMRKHKQREAQNTGGWDPSRWNPNVKIYQGSRPNSRAPFPRPYRPPPPPPTSPIQNEDPYPYRVGSPPRPDRPASITESVLAVMSQDGGPGSNVAEAASVDGSGGTELAHLKDPGVDLSDADTIMPDTDTSPSYDGTRKKYMQTVFERGLPLERLSRPSVRVPGAAARRNGTERRSYHPDGPSSSISPEPLRVHKKSASDADKEYEVEQKRSEAMAALEGQTPELARRGGEQAWI